MKVYKYFPNGVFDCEIEWDGGPVLPLFHTFEAPPQLEGHYAVMDGTWRLVEGAAPTVPTPLPPSAFEDINRAQRNEELRDTDWTQLPDVNLTIECKTAFADYRQKLRDIDLRNPDWPVRPQEEWAA